MLGLVIFDCDGVLVDSEPIASSLFAAHLKEVGLHMTVEECVHAFVGRSVAVNMQTITERIGRPLPEDFLPRLIEKANRAFEDELAPIKGIESALASINVPTCVASGSSPELIRRNLQITGLAHHFEGKIFSTHQVAHGKPAPDVFLFAAASMQVEPSQCAVVEDSVAGIQAGCAAGMQVFAYTGTFAASHLKGAGSCITFDDMSKLPDLLERHFAKRLTAVRPSQPLH